ncbi:hypothetical protein MMC19_001036 [Ptychographa xylographoides]|nr:hypothetical protein [Ptychographa xylographoides]
MSDLSNSDFRTTRSGRPIVLNRSLRGEQRSTPEILGKSSKKITKQKGRDKQKIPKLDAPLSVLTEEYKHIPMKDMDAWVNRSSEVRNKEVEKRNGYVTRPMNSFMLYRSAYADRCKIWCLQNNHQVVSSVCGSSWPMEPPEVREQFNEYARIERDNHQKAHPGYKFSPSKAQSSARKRKGASEDTDGDEASDHEDPDFDWRPAGGRRARGRTAIRSGREAGYPISNMLGIEANYGLNASSYQTVNPGKPMPAAMSDQELYSQYYQTSVRQSSNVPNVEDVYIRKTPMPGTQSGNAPPLIALPGAHHYELLDQNTFDNNQVVEEPQVDPTLLAFDNGFAQQTNSFITEQQFQDFNDESLFGIATQNYEHHGGQDVYGMQQMPWHFGEPQPRSGEDDFERWMAEKNDR